jgi:hypothetical protein
MKYWILIFAFVLGIIAGFTFVAPEQTTMTGAVPSTCYVENELCACGETICACGNQTIPKEYCA